MCRLLFLLPPLLCALLLPSPATTCTSKKETSILCHECTGEMATCTDGTLGPQKRCRENATFCWDFFVTDNKLKESWPASRGCGEKGSV